MLVMAERKYQFEWLMPTDNVDLDVYKDAINIHYLEKKMEDYKAGRLNFAEHELIEE